MKREWQVRRHFSNGVCGVSVGSGLPTSPDLDFVLQQRAASPSLTIAELITRFQQHFGVAVHRRTVERHLARQEKTR